MFTWKNQEVFFPLAEKLKGYAPRAELYGFPIRVRMNFSSLLNENRRTASIRPSSSGESPILPEAGRSAINSNL